MGGKAGGVSQQWRLYIRAHAMVKAFAPRDMEMLQQVGEGAGVCGDVMREIPGWSRNGQARSALLEGGEGAGAARAQRPPAAQRIRRCGRPGLLRPPVTAPHAALACAWLWGACMRASHGKKKRAPALLATWRRLVAS